MFSAQVTIFIDWDAAERVANLSGDQNSLQDILIGQASKAFMDKVSDFKTFIFGKILIPKAALCIRIKNKEQNGFLRNEF